MRVLRSKRLEIKPLAPSEYKNAVTVYRNSPGFMVVVSGHAPEAINLAMVEAEAREASEHGALYCGVFLRNSMELIGITTFERSHHEGKRGTAWIALLMISEPFQHDGYGAETYKIIERFILADPLVGHIELGVLVTNNQGREFWQTLGFLDFAAPDSHVLPSVIRMRKTRP
jgi:hypothetical protein